MEYSHTAAICLLIGLCNKAWISICVLGIENRLYMSQAQSELADFFREHRN